MRVRACVSVSAQFSVQTSRAVQYGSCIIWIGMILVPVLIPCFDSGSYRCSFPSFPLHQQTAPPVESSWTAWTKNDLGVDFKKCSICELASSPVMQKVIFLLFHNMSVLSTSLQVILIEEKFSLYSQWRKSSKEERKNFHPQRWTENWGGLAGRQNPKQEPMAARGAAG